MTKFNHLNKEQRDTIQYLIDQNKSTVFISKSIGIDRTSISKEVKRNRYIKSCFYEKFDEKGINLSTQNCPKLQKFPFVCNTCKEKCYCKKHKIFYHSNLANNHANEILVSSRQGINTDSDIIEQIDNIATPLISKQNHSVNQFYINHSDIIPFTQPTFYKYVNIGLFSFSNIDLPKKVKYKKRKEANSTEYKRHLKILVNRKYVDFLNYTIKHPKMSIYELDCLIGKQSDSKVLLDIYFRKSHFMLIKLLTKQNKENVTKQINNIKKTCGIELYKKIMRVGLTDNGNEFYDVIPIEYDESTGKKITNLFFCNPNSPWQKVGVEHNQRYIREVFPKGVSIQNLTVEQVKRLEDTINNIPRKSLGGQTPYQVMNKLFPQFIKLMNCNYIKPDDVSLTLKYILEGKMPNEK